MDDRLSENNHVICRLKPVSLLSDPVPEFEAISWCWGDASQKKPIELNGHIFEIPSNAEEVLRRVCVEHRHYLVWLDAVCINQGNIPERNHHVSTMVDVYSKAVRTVVLLGEGGNLTKAAMAQWSKF